jgi:hypothetical protein
MVGKGVMVKNAVVVIVGVRAGVFSGRLVGVGVEVETGMGDAAGVLGV